MTIEIIAERIIIWGIGIVFIILLIEILTRRKRRREQK